MLYYYVKMNRQARNGAPLDQRYKTARAAALFVNKRSRINLITRGAERLPERDGFVLYANHQGRYDGIGVLASSERIVSFAPDMKRKNTFPVNSAFRALDAFAIDRKSPRQAFEAIKSISSRVANGRNYVIFPEGIYDGSKHNSLYDFYSGCMRIPFETGCPVVPVCLYDTYRPFNSKGIRAVTCWIEYLEPIYYEEYKDLRNVELAALVRERIRQAIAGYEETERSPLPSHSA